MPPTSCCRLAVAALLAMALPTWAAPDSVVTFNEIFYHPPDPVLLATSAAPEWIELYNQMSIRVDLGGWTLRGGISYTFPEGTVMEPGAYLIVSAIAGSPPGAWGPFAGKLDNAGEEIRLHERWGRLMDRISYGDSGSWPSAPDGTGPSLAKSNRDAGSEAATSWTSSAQTGGTPGAENFPVLPETPPRLLFSNGSSWKYEATGVDPGPDWANPTGFSDATWTSAPAPLGTAAPLAPPVPVTLLPGAKPAYYFRKSFAWSGAVPNARLLLTGILKGTVECYFNGSPVASVTSPTVTGLTISPPALLPGANLLAIKLTPAPGFPDVVLDLAGAMLDGLTAVAPAPPPPLPGSIVINEISYHARPVYADPRASVPFSENPAEWIELHNPGQQAMDLSGWRFSDAAEYVFPAATSMTPGGYRLFQIANSRALWRMEGNASAFAMLAMP